MAASTMLSTRSILGKKAGSQNGKSERPAQPPIKCPECGGLKIWKDGLRYIKSETGTIAIQRYICRSCGRRFSETDPAPPSPRIRELSPRRKKNVDLFGSYLKPNTSHFKANGLTLPRQVCVTETQGAKNLVKVETRQKQAAGATKPDVETVKGKTVEFLWYLKKQGYAKDVVEHRFEAIKRLISLGADLWNPESIKETLAKQTDWKDGYKLQMVYSYENFLAMEGLTWQRPRYKQKSRLPFIPTEQEIDQLIAGVGKKLGTFLQGLKDTGVDPGELMKLRWIDINIETRKVSITPVKGHDPRVLKVSREFLRRLETIPRKSEYIFTNQDSMTCNFWATRRRLACKLNNPRLKAITFTTLRHWKGTMEYHRTRSLMHVKAFLGHKNIQNTILYVHLEALLFDEGNDEFHVTVAKNVKEASNLVKVGFQYVTGEYDDGGKIFRKRK